MATLADILLLISGNTMGLFGFILNSWMVAVNMKDYRAGIRLSPCDQILTLIGLTNLVLQTVLSWSATIFVFHTYITLNIILSEHLRLVNVFFLIFLIGCNFWLPFWLSSYYCLKIVTFKKRIFFVLKLRFWKFLPKLLVFSFVESLLFAVPSSCLVSVNGSDTFDQNTNSSNDSIRPGLFTVDRYYFVILLIKALILLTVTLIPIYLTLSSLVRHAKRMKKNGLFTPQMEAHITATRSIVLLVLLYTFFYMSCVSIVLKRFNMEEILIFWFYVFTYPMAQAIVIILGNSKLKKAAKSILKFLKIWREDELRKASEMSIQ